MKQIDKSFFTIGKNKLTVPVQVYESWDEIHKEITPAQSLEKFNKGGLIALNNKMTDLATKIAEDVTKQKPTEKEGSVAYLTRVLNTPELFTAFQNAVSASVKAKPIRVNAKPQQAGPKDIAKAWKDQALSWIKGEVNEKTGKKKDIAALNTALSAALGKTYAPVAGQPTDAPVNVLALGALLKEFNA